MKYKSYMYIYVHILFLQWATLESVCAIDVLEVLSAIKMSTKSQWSRFSQIVVRLPSPDQKSIVFRSSEVLLISA